MIGQPSPAAVTYYPPHDESIPFAERTEALHQWLTRYYQHGEPTAEETLAVRDGLKEPSSTLDRISKDDLAESVYDGPGDLLSGSDTLTVKMCFAHRLYAPLKDSALYLPPAQGDSENGADSWRNVEVRLMWCDQSIWPMVWGPPLLHKELKEARAAGRSTRNVSFVRLRGANHYAHWDFPEKTLRAFIGDEEEL
ncbi:hypothetical protein GSI_04704 [Ganoderma sinense ZZ0214-1]|uniref:AB hydrolase-1 domain-containing protein n=1 Tax=Ganoderma sinense ZZ0214-1 TaxID=1077348 RepID=A0A2G8SHK3_9APHY|nr:hypothetical protein GSI_04704 [Ganoderma sinense ZZ0214-1]